jgi:hypothetical protein
VTADRSSLLDANLDDIMRHGPRILCAANWYKTEDKVPHQPKNIDQGFVVSGHRHCSIYPVAAHLSGEEWDALRRNEEHGFLTSDNRWVNRQEGYAIAETAGQLNMDEVRRRGGDRTLYSEDIY